MEKPLAIERCRQVYSSLDEDQQIYLEGLIRSYINSELNRRFLRTGYNFLKELVASTNIIYAGIRGSTSMGECKLGDDIDTIIFCDEHDVKEVKYVCEELGKKHAESLLKDGIVRENDPIVWFIGTREDYEYYKVAPTVLDIRKMDFVTLSETTRAGYIIEAFSRLLYSTPFYRGLLEDYTQNPFPVVERFIKSMERKCVPRIILSLADGCKKKRKALAKARKFIGYTLFFSLARPTGIHLHFDDDFEKHKIVEARDNYLFYALENGII